MRTINTLDEAMATKMDHHLDSLSQTPLPEEQKGIFGLGIAGKILALRKAIWSAYDSNNIKDEGNIRNINERIHELKAAFVQSCGDKLPLAETPDVQLFFVAWEKLTAEPEPELEPVSSAPATVPPTPQTNHESGDSSTACALSSPHRPSSWHWCTRLRLSWTSCSFLQTRRPYKPLGNTGGNHSPSHP